ncbi:MAG: hypothetical protein IKQ87_02120, partial [Clostridia bacterium]|nr:hypothetical protein [Clostridia bacterium]
MIVTQPYRFPTSSCLTETCAADGGVSEGEDSVFRPDGMVGRGGEPAVGNDFAFTLVDHPFVRYPFFPVPEFHVRRDVLNRDESPVREDGAVFREAGELGDFPLLPEVSVDAVLDDRDVKHLARALAVDIP